MFCDKCGTQLQQDQAFCSRCGRQILAAIPMTRPMRGRVQEHVRLLGLLWLAFSAFNTLGAIALYIVANTVFGRFGLEAQGGPRAFLHPLLSILAILLFAKAAVGFIAGWGLLQRDRWARVITLVLGFISMFMNIPFGTALGIYTLWVLLPSESEEEYERLSEAKAAA